MLDGGAVKFRSMADLATQLGDSWGKWWQMLHETFGFRFASKSFSKSFTLNRTDKCPANVMVLQSLVKKNVESGVSYQREPNSRRIDYSWHLGELPQKKGVEFCLNFRHCLTSVHVALSRATARRWRWSMASRTLAKKVWGDTRRGGDKLQIP